MAGLTPGNQEAKSADEVIFNLSDFLNRQKRADKQAFDKLSPGTPVEQRQASEIRSVRSQEAWTALANNQLENPVVDQVLQERLTEFYRELEATRTSLESLRSSPAEYQKALSNYETKFRYYQGINKNSQEFFQLRNQKAPKPPLVEQQKQKLVTLGFPPNEQLLPAGNEQGAWASGNARFVEKSLFRSFVAMGVNLPFSPEDIYSGMARDLSKHPLPNDCKLTNGQPPVLWLEYGLEELNDRVFMVRVSHAINSPEELVQILKGFSSNSEYPMRRIAINIRKDVAVQLTPENLRQHPGVLTAIAHELSRYCLPPEEAKKIAGVKFVV